MDTPPVDLSTASDAELIRWTKAGHEVAYSELFVRHQPVALAVARSVARPEHVEDVVSEAFARVLSLLREGRGPGLAFRPYLLATVRNVNLNVIRSTKRETLIGDHSEVENLDALDDGVDAWLENNTISRAYRRLPRRWQTVLWLTAVEKRPNDEIAQQLGIKSNAVAALAFRAREGLREAYLADHLKQVSEPECQRVVDLLPAYLRGNLTARRHASVEEHISTCLSCAPLIAELQTANRNFAALIAPLVVGPLLAKMMWNIDEVQALPWLGHAAESIVGPVASSGWFLGAKAAAGIAAAATVGAVVAGGSSLVPHPRTGQDRRADVEVTRLDATAATRRAVPESTLPKPSPTRSGANPSGSRSATRTPHDATTTATPAPTARSTGTPGNVNRHPGGTSPAPTASTAPTAPTAPTASTASTAPTAVTPAPYVPNPRLASPSYRTGLFWTTASLPVVDARPGTTMTVTTKHVVLAGTENLWNSGWSCAPATFQWFQDGLWATTTFVCTWNGSGTGVLKLAYRLFGVEAPLTAKLTSTPGGNANPRDDVAQLTLR